MTDFNLETTKTLLSDAIRAFSDADADAVQAAAQNIFQLQKDCEAAAAREAAQDDKAAA